MGRGVDLVGQKFWKLTVVGRAGVDKNRRVLWECLCECGGSRVVPTRYLQRGSRRDCGCGDRERYKQWGKDRCKDERPQVVNKILDTYKRNAASKNITFALSNEDFELLILSKCFYCGAEPSNSKSLRDFTLMWNGIDRKNNSEGYTDSNVVSCCSDCNFMKNSRDFDEFLNKVRRIYENVSY